MAGKPLIIAEKPSAAMAIAQALGGFQRRDGYLESAEYLLSWAIGHLVELLPPEAYDPRWKRWTMETLPILPEGFGLHVLPKTRSQFRTLARLGKQAPLLVNACDAGREGELIFRYICAAAGLEKPVMRLWVSALTPAAIRAAFAEMKPQEHYDRLYRSARCRAEGDWLVGINATRAFTVKFGELLSAGRVQTPTLAMVVRREREIESFRPEPYWEVFAAFRTPDGREYTGKWFGPDGDRLSSADAAEAVVRRVRRQAGWVEASDERPVAERPPQLFDLTSLQREANRRYGLTAAATLKAAQALYEAKHITYPRTDSRYLSRALVPQLPALVRALSARSDLAALAAGADLSRVGFGNRRVVDDAKVTDHHAILPTSEVPRSLTGAEAKIYDLIVRRFLAQFYPDARFLEQEVVTCVGELPDRFRSRGRRLVDPGWRQVEPEPARKRRAAEDEEEEGLQLLPPLRMGEPVAVGDVESREKATRPPRRYTEATLLSAMEYAGREITDEALREAMKGHGLGTPATRAAIIERLKEMGYIITERRSLVPTAKGRRLVELAERAGVEVLLSPELTGEWEHRIAGIQSGEYDDARFMQEIRELTARLVERIRATEGAPGRGGAGRSSTAEPGPAKEEPAAGEPPLQDRLPTPCPRCGGPVTRGSRGWTCATAGCGLRIPTFLCGKVIDGGAAEALLSRGRTPLITGFTSPRTGRRFSAFLVLKEDGQVGFEFPPDRRGSRRTRKAPGEGGAPSRGPGEAETSSPNRSDGASAGVSPRRGRPGSRAGARKP